MKKAKLAIAASVLVLAVGGFGVSQANAAAHVYTKGDAQFCASGLKDKVIKEGSSGNCVRVMQYLLNKENIETKGHQLSVDGDFGPMTKKIVEEREKRMKWGVDGIVGTGTFDSLANLKTTPAGKATITGIITNKSTSSSSSSHSSSSSSHSSSSHSSSSSNHSSSSSSNHSSSNHSSSSSTHNSSPAPKPSTPKPAAVSDAKIKAMNAQLDAHDRASGSGSSSLFSCSSMWC